MGIKNLIKGRLDMYRVDPSTLVEDKGWNVRIEGPELEAHIRYLADSIKEEGVKEPLTCYIKDDELHITNGHCRLKAVELAMSEGVEILTVPVRLEDRFSKAEDRVLSMVTRNSGKSLNQLELGEIFKRLLKYGWTVAQIAKKTSFSSQHVNNILALSGAPTEVTDMVRDGKISPTLASNTVNKEGVLAAEVLQDAIDGAIEDGKKKATQKDVNKVKGKKHKKKSIPWKNFGPQMYKILHTIHEETDEYPDGFESHIEDMGTLLSEIEEKYGDLIKAESTQKQQEIDW